MIDAQNKWQRNWRNLRRPLATIALCGVVTITLQGCIEMAVGGAVAMGGLSASDRRTIGAQTEDKGIVFKAGNRIGHLIGDGGHVNINSYNRKVLLTGEVRDEQMKAAVEREAAAIEGVVSVVNELEVSGTSSITSRTSDTIITGKVKASLVDAKDISANLYKVVTERGTVYLMGRVTQREGRIAGEVASGVSGVTRVVKIFEYIEDDKVPQAQASQGS
ncbi:MAG: BON domain-containing protein [Burkholderiaceae bacterium]